MWTDNNSWEIVKLGHTKTKQNNSKLNLIFQWLYKGHKPYKTLRKQHKLKTKQQKRTKTLKKQQKQNTQTQNNKLKTIYKTKQHKHRTKLNKNM